MLVKNYRTHPDPRLSFETFLDLYMYEVQCEAGFCVLMLCGICGCFYRKITLCH